MFSGRQIGTRQSRFTWWRRRPVFVSYRRRDAADMTGRICDRLRRELGPRHVFRDLESIPLGNDFYDCIEHTIPRCRVVLAVIGPAWHICPEADGRRYLDDPKDLVGFELACALRNEVRIIPVLVGGATMPKPEELPEQLRKLTNRQGIEVRRDPDFHRDMDLLLAGL